MVLAECVDIDDRIVARRNHFSDVAPAGKHVVLLLAQVCQVAQEQSLILSLLVYPKQARVDLAELRAVEEALHVLIAEFAFCHIGVWRIRVSARKHPV